MIFYFSGTGNSLYAAKKIGKYNKENLVSIASIMNSKDGCYEYTLEDNEAIGFVYPVYSWAPPKMVLQFIEKLKFSNYKNNYIFTVATCGKNIGNTMKVMDASLKKRSLSLMTGFSIQMPNNYMVFGDVDTKEVEQKKLLDADTRLNRINKIIEERKEGIYEVEKGILPGVLTSIINPLFNKNAINTKKFYVNDKCTGCGICESVCNCKSIKVGEKPAWGEKCSLCLACVNLCPAKAIQYGKETEGKGRYRNPNIDLNEMKIL